MARENSVLLYGQVHSIPTIRVLNGEPILGVFQLKVIRRPSNSSGFDSKLYVDLPIIRTKNIDMINCIRDLEKGDIITVKGTLTTRETIKKSICAHCGTENASQGNVQYITPIMIRKDISKAFDIDAIENLKKYNEVSNQVFLIGNVCRVPHYYVDETNRTYAQFQLAVNRRYRIHEDPADIKTDYPWVKTFGRQATKDAENLILNSHIYINGALQTREIERHLVCSSCSEGYIYKEAVMEVVPYYIGYLANCGNISESEGEEIESKGLENIELDGGGKDVKKINNESIE